MGECISAERLRFTTSRLQQMRTRGGFKFKVDSFILIGLAQQLVVKVDFKEVVFIRRTLTPLQENHPFDPRGRGGAAAEWTPTPVREQLRRTFRAAMC